MSGNNKGILLKGVQALPLQIPGEILEAQTYLSSSAVLLWINLLAFAQQQRPITLDGVAQYMGVKKRAVEEALATLAERGWINDEDGEIILQVPTETAVTSEESAPLLDEKQASFEWLINFWSHRLGSPGPDEMRKLGFWMEQKGLTCEVIAAGVEEMCAAVENPHLGYLEGILRNWYSEGVRSYSDLVERPYLARALPCSTPQDIHPEAKRKWKELFPDEFDE